MRRKAVATHSHCRYPVPVNKESAMVVCVCNAIRENDVRRAARSGAMSACQAYRALGRQAKCGQCVPFAREIIDEERAIA
jgi:bacterioferritin-associated ferredoxin